MSTSRPSDRERPTRDTDRVSDKTLTRRHGRDVDNAAERSSGYPLDEHDGQRDENTPDATDTGPDSAGPDDADQSGGA